MNKIQVLIEIFFIW